MRCATGCSVKDFADHVLKELPPRLPANLPRPFLGSTGGTILILVKRHWEAVDID
jgi:hypothetical protein